MNANALLLILVLPFAAFVVLGLFGRKYLNRYAGWIGTIALLGATAVAMSAAGNYFFVSGKAGEAYMAQVPVHFTWLTFSPGMSIDMGLLLDPISAMMIVVVTFVSLMVHI